MVQCCAIMIWLINQILTISTPSSPVILPYLYLKRVLNVIIVNTGFPHNREKSVKLNIALPALEKSIN